MITSSGYFFGLFVCLFVFFVCGHERYWWLVLVFAVGCYLLLFRVLLFYLIVTAEAKPDAKSSLVNDDDLPKFVTTKKLNGLNYLAWAHAVKIFLCGKKSHAFLLNFH